MRDTTIGWQGREDADISEQMVWDKSETRFFVDAPLVELVSRVEEHKSEWTSRAGRIGEAWPTGKQTKHVIAAARLFHMIATVI